MQNATAAGEAEAAAPTCDIGEDLASAAGAVPMSIGDGAPTAARHKVSSMEGPTLCCSAAGSSASSYSSSSSSEPLIWGSSTSEEAGDANIASPEIISGATASHLLYHDEPNAYSDKDGSSPAAEI